MSTLISLKISILSCYHNLVYLTTSIGEISSIPGGAEPLLRASFQQEQAAQHTGSQDSTGFELFEKKPVAR
jgi:hypothetical protein